MTRPFDPDGDQGNVIPPENNAVHYQEGHYYNNEFEEVDVKTGEVIGARAPRPQPVRREAPPPTRPRKSTRIAEEAAEAALQPAKETVIGKAIDLQLWLEGKAPSGDPNYSWFRVKAEIGRQFGKVPQNAAEGRVIVSGQ